MAIFEIARSNEPSPDPFCSFLKTNMEQSRIQDINERLIDNNRNLSKHFHNKCQSILLEFNAMQYNNRTHQNRAAARSHRATKKFGKWNDCRSKIEAMTFDRCHISFSFFNYLVPYIYKKLHLAFCVVKRYGSDIIQISFKQRNLAKCFEQCSIIWVICFKTMHDSAVVLFKNIVGKYNT